MGFSDPATALKLALHLLNEGRKSGSEACFPDEMSMLVGNFFYVSTAGFALVSERVRILGEYTHFL